MPYTFQMPLWKVMISTYKVRFLAVCAFNHIKKKETVAKHSTFDSGGGAPIACRLYARRAPGQPRQGAATYFLRYRWWIYVGCSQNHPYCGEWLPNQVFRRRGLRPIRGAGHSNSLFQRETDSREGCRHGRSRMEN